MNNTKHKYYLLMRGMKIESHTKFIFELIRSIYVIFIKSGSYSNGRFRCYHYAILFTRAAQRVTADGAPVFGKISMRILFNIRAESIISIVTSRDLKTRRKNRISHFLIHKQNYLVCFLGFTPKTPLQQCQYSEVQHHPYTNTHAAPVCEMHPKRPAPRTCVSACVQSYPKHNILSCGDTCPIWTWFIHNQITYRSAPCIADESHFTGMVLG